MPQKVSDPLVPDEPTFPCKICGRRFVQASLVKHEPACKKLSKLNRKPFDSGKQRATGSDITYADVKRAQKEREKMGGIYPRPQTNWKERHETFIDAVSSSKKVDYAIKTGAPLPPPPRTAVPSDYVQCDYCGRNFSESAAERHIPFCREQNSRKVVPTSMKPLSTHHKQAASRNEERRDASTAYSRASETRSRSDSRKSNRDRDSSHSRKAPTESRSGTRPTQTAGRTTTQSAGIRQAERNDRAATPAKRSNSAPKTPSSRLKTPTPMASRIKAKW